MGGNKAELGRRRHNRRHMEGAAAARRHNPRHHTHVVGRLGRASGSAVLSCFFLFNVHVVER